jgi:hypothetical protein
MTDVQQAETNAFNKRQSLVGLDLLRGLAAMEVFLGIFAAAPLSNSARYR